MKKLKFMLVIITFMGLILIGCSDNSQSPLEPTDQGSVVSLNKKGPVVHSVEGSGLLSTPERKNLGARYTAHEYADGTFDGEFEVNCANATGDHDFKLNGNVISFKVYEGVGQYNGNMAVFLGMEKTGIFTGVYCVFFAIDNGNPGQTSDPDQVNGILMELPSKDFQIPEEWAEGPDGCPSSWVGLTILDFYNMSPEELITNLYVMDCDKGNITVK